VYAVPIGGLYLELRPSCEFEGDIGESLLITQLLFVEGLTVADNYLDIVVVAHVSTLWMCISTARHLWPASEPKTISSYLMVR